MRILGIDPGSVKTGWGMIEREGNRITGIAAGVIRTPKAAPMAARLLHIHRGLLEVIQLHKPHHAAVEQIFQAKYAASALKLGQARGVALLSVAHAELELSEYAPALIKRTVAGGGRAHKSQVAQLVGTILGWHALPAEDATDALAVAITHAQALRVSALVNTVR